MSFTPGTNSRTFPLLCWLLVLLCCLCLVPGAFGQEPATPQPVLSLNFNEGSGSYALDASGGSGAGTIVGAIRADNTGCGRSLLFDGSESYVSVPYSAKNHPENEISVSLWFFADEFSPGTLISTYDDGGYRFGFDDGGDLWWTVNVEGFGDVSVPVRHEGITLRQWHHITGTYDGNEVKVYLDGVLRNQAVAPGTIHYEHHNYIQIATDAGPGNQPYPGCRENFIGGIDEVRIFDIALTQGEIIDDRFQCSQEPGVPPALPAAVSPSVNCNPVSGSLVLNAGESAVRLISFRNQTENGTWTISVPPGSALIVSAQDHYSRTDPDAWYIDLGSPDGRINRGVAFPNTNNAPIKGVVNKGTAQVLIRYFDGPGRFPATVSVRFECIAPPKKEAPQNTVLNNPIIVIYSASWATLIALILVMVGLHLRHKTSKK